MDDPILETSGSELHFVIDETEGQEGPKAGEWPNLGQTAGHPATRPSTPHLQGSITSRSQPTRQGKGKTESFVGGQQS